MFEEINSWFKNGAGYLPGLALLEQYGSNAFLLRILKKEESESNRRKLTAALQELLDEQSPGEPLPADPLPAAPPPSADPPPVPVVPRGEPALMKVNREIKQNYAEINALHPLQSITNEGPELHEISKRLVILTKKNAELWTRHNYLTENPGALEPGQPESPAPVMVDLNILMHKESLRKLICATKKRLSKQNPQKANTLALLADQEQQYKEISARVAELKAGGVR